MPAIYFVEDNALTIFFRVSSSIGGTQKNRSIRELLKFLVDIFKRRTSTKLQVTAMYFLVDIAFTTFSGITSSMEGILKNGSIREGFKFRADIH